MHEEFEVRTLVAIAACALVGALTAVPTHAAGNGTKSSNPPASTQSTTSVNWNQRDTAVYVVSTINLLHNHKGRSLTSVFKRHLNVAKYEVWADQSNSSLYFIQMKTDSGQTVAGLAYQMGWQKPRGLSGSLQRLGVQPAPDAVDQAFKNDPKTLISTFTTTLPS